MHELKKLLDEIETMEKEPGIVYIPNAAFNAGLTAEELILYTVYCRHKGEGNQLPDLATIAKQASLNEKLAKITIAALAAKGITYD